MPLVDPWTVRFANDAERRFALLPAERRPPRRWFEVPGWRVLLDTGTPVDPARQIVDGAGASSAHDVADRQGALIAALESGGRPTALTSLEGRRAAALTRLKLASPAGAQADLSEQPAHSPA